MHCTPVQDGFLQGTFLQAPVSRYDAFGGILQITFDNSKNEEGIKSTLDPWLIWLVDWTLVEK